MFNLIMKTPESLPDRKGLIVLDKAICDSQLSKPELVIALKKQPPGVLK
jgi:hypothetical protein